MTTFIPKSTLLAMAVAAFALACAHEPMPLPGHRTDYTVTRLAPRGPYFEATLSGGRLPVVYFASPTETCLHVLAAEAVVQYVVSGPYGVLERDGQRCVPAGIGSLGWWRDRRRRPDKSFGRRGQATFEIIFEESDAIGLRGRFPIAGLVGWAGGGDSIAVLPTAPEACRAIAAAGVASMEYRSGGPDALYLIGSNDRCPIAGLIRPDGQAGDATVE